MSTSVLPAGLANGWVMRPWASFAEFASFSLPSSSSELMSRADANLRYYKTNYAVIMGVIFSIVIYSNVKYLFALGVAAGLGAAAFFADGIVIKGHRFSFQERLAFIGVELFFVLWMFSSLESFYWSIGVSAVVTIIHASFRKNSIKSKVSNTLSDVKKDIREMTKAN